MCQTGQEGSDLNQQLFWLEWDTMGGPLSVRLHNLKENTMQIQTQSLIKATRDLLNAVRGSSIKIGENLYNLKQSLEAGTDWGDLIRDEFDISEGFASKLISIHKAFVLEGGISQEDLEGIDGEKLYLALRLEGTAEEKVSRAKTLTRRELREERVDDGHEHSGETVLIHKCCGMRVDNAA